MLMKHSVLPMCRWIEERVNKDLSSRYDRNVFVAFDDPVPADREQQREDNVADVTAGVYSRDEIRSELGKEPRGGMADELLADSRFSPLEKLGQDPEPVAVPQPLSEEQQAEDAAKVAAKAREKLREMLGNK